MSKLHSTPIISYLNMYVDVILLNGQGRRGATSKLHRIGNHVRIISHYRTSDFHITGMALSTHRYIQQPPKSYGSLAETVLKADTCLIDYVMPLRDLSHYLWSHYPFYTVSTVAPNLRTGGSKYSGISIFMHT